MTTQQRNADSLALLAPLACPIIDLLCVAYVALARRARAVIEALKADRAARRALASHRAAMLAPVHRPMNVAVPVVPTVYDAASPVLGDDDLVIDPALLSRLAELASESIGETYTVAACSPVNEPAPERKGIEVEYVKVGAMRLTEAGERINAANSACRCVATTKQGTRCKRDRAGKLFTCNQHKGYQPESVTLEAYASLLASNERDDTNAD